MDEGPYRRFETGLSSSDDPLYYADFVYGHPDLFNCVTEIRDDNGYEWFPSNDVAASITHGTSQLERAFDSRVLATLFSHGGFIHTISAGNFASIMQGISANIADEHPIFMTMDAACQYVRAVTESKIASGSYDATAKTVTTHLTGSTDVPTVFSLFTADGDQISERRVDVPAFTTSSQVVANQVVTAPQISNVSAGTPADASASVSWTTDEPASSRWSTVRRRPTGR